MKTMVERLKEQKRRSSEFERKSFGMPVGDGFTELVREITTDQELARHLSFAAILQTLQADKLVKHDTSEGAAVEKAVYLTPLTHLYWGIEIGRQIEREQREAEATQSEAAKVEP